MYLIHLRCLLDMARRSFISNPQEDWWTFVGGRPLEQLVEDIHTNANPKVAKPVIRIICNNNSQFRKQGNSMAHHLSEEEARELVSSSWRDKPSERVMRRLFSLAFKKTF